MHHNNQIVEKLVNSSMLCLRQLQDFMLVYYV